jgi:hypothetical protein
MELSIKIKRGGYLIVCSSPSENSTGETLTTVYRRGEREARDFAAMFAEERPGNLAYVVPVLSCCAGPGAKNDDGAAQ